MGIKMPETCWDSVNNQHPLLTINHLYCCILLVFFPHALLTMHGHRNIKLSVLFYFRSQNHVQHINLYCLSYGYWTVHHLDSWVKRDQLDVTCFIISLFNARHVSDVNTSIFRILRLICWVISWVVLIWFDVCWCYVVVWLWWCGIRMQVEALVLQPAATFTSNQINTTHKITQRISRKLLRMDVLTSETCWALNKEIIKQVTFKLVSLYSTTLNFISEKVWLLFKTTCQ